MAADYLRYYPQDYGNQRTWTFSGWIKKTKQETNQNLLSPRYGGDGSNESQMGFKNDDTFRWYDSGGTALNYTSTFKFRDVGWYHIVCSLNTLLDRTYDRAKVYINGYEITDWGTQTAPSQRAKLGWTRYFMDIGKAAYTTNYYAEGPMFDFYFVDGHQLTPDVFGYPKEGQGYQIHDGMANDAATSNTIIPGQWLPRSPSAVKKDIERRNGGFGATGFYLPMNGQSQPGHDWHCDADYIIKLKDEDAQQPICGAPTTSNNFVDQLRDDPFKDNIALAIPLIYGAQSSGYGDYSADIKGSGTNKTITTHNDMDPSNTSDAADSPYGSSGEFNGSDKYLSSNNFPAFGTGDFTIEWWMKPDDISTTYGGLVEFTASTGAKRIEIAFQSSAIHIYTDTGSWRSTGYGPQTQQWVHIAFEKHNGKLSMYVNGVMKWSVTNSRDYDETSTLKIGYHSGYGYYNGQMFDIRVYQGIAKYKGGFECQRHFNGHDIEKRRTQKETINNTFACLDENATLVNGNSNKLDNCGLHVDCGTGGWHGQLSTIGIPKSNTDKWYWEGYAHTMSGSAGYHLVFGLSINEGCKVRALNDNQYWGTDEGDYMVAGHQNGNWVVVNENNFTPTIASSTTPPITIMCAYDASTKKIWWGHNGTWYNSGNPAAGTNHTQQIAETDFNEVLPVAAVYTSGTDLWVNFGQDPTFGENQSYGTVYNDTSGYGEFKYQPPSGFKAICTANLPDVPIKDPGDYFRTIRYAGTSHVNQKVTQVGFRPDLVWIKRQDTTQSWVAGTSIRPAGHFLALNGTGAEANEEDKFKCVNEFGFDVGNHNGTGHSGSGYAAYAWKAGGNSNVYNYDGVGYATAAAMNSATGVNMHAGSINVDSCTINSKSKLSIITWGGTAAAGDLAHGLGATPGMIHIKKISASGNSWASYITGVGAQQQLLLNSGNGISADANGFDALPDANLVHVGSGAAMATNQAGTNMAWIWAPVEGYSKFGKYKGNNHATEGSLVHCGFRPAWVMIKRRDGSQDWTVFSSASNSHNPLTRYVHPSGDGGEGTYQDFSVDFYSTGFRPRDNLNHINASEIYLYAAFAEAPTRYALGR